MRERDKVVLDAVTAGGRCPQHPRYQKKRKPTGTCENCWFLWFLTNLANGTLELKLT